MQARAADLDIVNGEIVRKERRAVDAARRRWRAPCPSGLAAEDTFESKHMVYPYGVHIAVVRVDADTGGVAIERYAIAYDVGRAVNPMLVEGQIAGGLAQGIGGALLEEFLYDEQGEPLSVTFADYLMPTAREVPALQACSSPRTRRARSIRSASRAPAKAAPIRSARRLPRPSTTPSASPAR